jgi:hypothetical protein
MSHPSVENASVRQIPDYGWPMGWEASARLSSGQLCFGRAPNRDLAVECLINGVRELSRGVPPTEGHPKRQAYAHVPGQLPDCHGHRCGAIGCVSCNRPIQRQRADHGEARPADAVTEGHPK